MSIFQNLCTCIASREDPTVTGYGDRRYNRLKFGVALTEAFTTKGHESKEDISLPKPLWDMLLVLATEGVNTPHLFRKNGNIKELSEIINRLSKGHTTLKSSYNVHTLANVVKRFLADIPGGLLGKKGEEDLMNCVPDRDNVEDVAQLRALFLSVIDAMPRAAYELTVFLLGIWYRMVVVATVSTNNNSVSEQDAVPLASSTGDVTIDSEDIAQEKVPSRIVMAQSVGTCVAGSLFHTCVDSPHLVARAVKVLQCLILSFPELGDDIQSLYIRLTTKPTNMKGGLHSAPLQKPVSIVRKVSDRAITSLEQFTSRKPSKDIPQTKSTLPPPSQQGRLYSICSYLPVVIAPQIAQDSKTRKSSLTASLSKDASSRARFESMRLRQEALLRRRGDWFFNGPDQPSQALERPTELGLVTCGVGGAGGSTLYLMTPESPYEITSGPDLLQSCAGQEGEEELERPLPSSAPVTRKEFSLELAESIE